MQHNRVFKFSEMLKLQNELNEHTLPFWKDHLTLDHFRVAMFDELSELLRSTSFKWWKKANKHDLWNIKIEAIDILHFAVSVLLLKEYDKHVDCETPINFGYAPNERKTVTMTDGDGNLHHKEFISNALNMLEATTPTQFQHFFKSVGMDVVEVSAIYMAKVTLNKIRQNCGYKTGEYLKMKGDKEDNELLEDFVTVFLDDDDMTLDDLQFNIISFFECEFNEK